MKHLKWVIAALFFSTLAAGCTSGPTQQVTRQTPYPPEKTVSQTASPIPATENQPKVTALPGWKGYTEQRLGIIFQLPKAWQRVERNGALHEFEGQDGFLTFGNTISPVFSNETLTDICQKEIELADAKYQALGQKPYGEHPKVESIQVDHQDACLISPSTDQDAHFETRSLLVCEYPPDFTLKSGQPRVFTMEADKDHIEGIAETIRFIPREFGQ
jgi:hypothetical protein